MSEAKKSPADAALEALEAAPGSTAEQLADKASLGVSTVRKALAQLESEGKATRAAGGREGGRKLPDTWTAVHESASAEAESAARLPKGHLNKLIVEHLKTCSGQALSPGALRKAIGHSAGAISNALRKLADKGEVQEISSKPKRYSISS